MTLNMVEGSWFVGSLHPDPNAFLREMSYGNRYLLIGVDRTLLKLSSNLGTVS
jgi:hypothetical protein